MSYNNFDYSHLLPKEPEFDTQKMSLLIRDHKLADYQYEIIIEAIKKFEADLDDSLEVAVQLASFGQSIILQVTDIGYSNPSLIHFYGYVNGKQSELIQHVNQLSFLLTAVQKANPDKPAKRIGFDLDS